MKERNMVTSMSSKVQVCITSYTNGEIMGTIYNDYYNKKILFLSASDLINKMESLYNSLSFPQKFMEPRSFGVKKTGNAGWENAERAEESADEEVDKTGIANFIIHVKFRMNADWQGDIKWLEKGINQSFHSTLEMIKLILAALEV